MTKGKGSEVEELPGSGSVPSGASVRVMRGFYADLEIPVDREILLAAAAGYDSYPETWGLSTTYRLRT